MSGKDEIHETDSGSEDSNETDSKVIVLETYSKDKAIFRDMFNRLIEESTKQFEASLPANSESQKAKIRYKNILIDHCNVVLRAYGQQLRITSINNAKQGHRESNVHLKHKDPVLQKQEDLMRELVSKSQQCRNLTPAAQLEINLQAPLPKKFFVQQQKGKVQVSDILPEMQPGDERHKNEIVAKLQASRASAYTKMTGWIEKSEEDWNKWVRMGSKSIDKTKGRESTRSKKAVEFQAEGFNDLSFDN